MSFKPARPPASHLNPSLTIWYSSITTIKMDYLDPTATPYQPMEPPTVTKKPYVPPHMRTTPGPTTITPQPATKLQVPISDPASRKPPALQLPSVQDPSSASRKPPPITTYPSEPPPTFTLPQLYIWKLQQQQEIQQESSSQLSFQRLQSHRTN